MSLPSPALLQTGYGCMHAYMHVLLGSEGKYIVRTYLVHPGSITLNSKASLMCGSWSNISSATTVQQELFTLKPAWTDKSLHLISNNKTIFYLQNCVHIHLVRKYPSIWKGYAYEYWQQGGEEIEEIEDPLFEKIGEALSWLVSHLASYKKHSKKCHTHTHTHTWSGGIKRRGDLPLCRDIKFDWSSCIAPQSTKKNRENDERREENSHSSKSQKVLD